MRSLTLHSRACLGVAVEPVGGPTRSDECPCVLPSKKSADLTQALLRLKPIAEFGHHRVWRDSCKDGMDHVAGIVSEAKVAPVKAFPSILTI
jgi:hypothetical protein